MMRYKAVFVAVAMAMAFSAFAADPTISVEARQRYPWNGLVDLKFIITGTSGMMYDTSFTAADVDGGTNITMATVRKSNGVAANVAKEQLTPGTYNWVWDAAADLPKDFKCNEMTITGRQMPVRFRIQSSSMPMAVRGRCPTNRLLMERQRH